MLIYVLKCTERLCLTSFIFFLSVLSIVISESKSNMDQTEGIFYTEYNTPTF